MDKAKGFKFPIIDSRQEAYPRFFSRLSPFAFAFSVVDYASIRFRNVLNK